MPLDQMRPMLRTLLAERFNLTVRRETRRARVSELVPADSGLKFAAMKEGGCITQGTGCPGDIGKSEATIHNDACSA